MKTLAGWRKVPLHPALIEAGFLTYVEKVRAARETRLFPQWTPRVDPEFGGTVYAHKAVKWGSDRLRALRHNGKIARSKATYFQSMRHSLTNHLKQTLVDESLRCAIVGHEHGGINENRYGDQYAIKTLGDKMVETMTDYAELLK